MRYYRTGDVAKLIGVSHRTILNWIKSGKIAAIRVGKEYRIPESEVMRVMHEIKPNKVVIYVEGEDEEDVKRQVEELKEFCSKKGYEVVQTIVNVNDQKEKGLEFLFWVVECCKIAKLIIFSKDVLTRYCDKFIEQYFKVFGVEVVEAGKKE